MHCSCFHCSIAFDFGNMNDHPAKRLKTTPEQSQICQSSWHMNTPFECLSAELILNVFEYFNVREMFQSFSNLNSFITSCLFDRHQQLHLHLDHQMSSLPEKYFSEQVISLRIESLIIPISTFINLKSLLIVSEHRWKNDDCLNMIKEVSTK